jgi:hypothetical protein
MPSPTDPPPPAAAAPEPRLEGDAERVLERWTIDEIDESTVRLLVCRAIATEVERDPLAVGGKAGDAAGDPAGDPAARVQDAVMAIEAGDPDATWTDETDTYVDRAALEAFLGARRAVAGLPEPRPIREGDVFWVFVPASGDGAAESPGGPSPMGAGPGPGPAAATGLPVGAEVWDVTAAARQSIKRRYVLAAGGNAAPGES